jgi:hypothetical protein
MSHEVLGMQDGERILPAAALPVAGTPPYDVSVPGCAGASDFCIAGCVDGGAVCGALWACATPPTANRQTAPAASISFEFISTPWFIRKLPKTFSRSLLISDFRSANGHSASMLTPFRRANPISAFRTHCARSRAR